MASGCKTVYRRLWDGDNVIAEIVEEPGKTNEFVNVWGLDILGSLSESGGVGALLCVRTKEGVFFPIQDSIGNVAAYISTNGDVVAKFAYGPFGEFVSEEGPLAGLFDIRYASKTWCPYTKQVEFERRRYFPVVGRFISRDPLGESETGTLYSYAGNDPINNWDYLGLLKDSDVETRCNNILSSRQNKKGWKYISGGQITEEGKTACENRYHQILSDVWNEQLRPLLSQAQLYPRSCEPVAVQCRCCGYHTNFTTKGWSATFASFSNQSGKPQITICWDNIFRFNRNLSQEITHETTHYLQFCSGRGPNQRTCKDSLKREIEARICANQCESFDECFKLALWSSCKSVSGFCTKGSDAKDAIKAVDKWYKEKIKGNPMTFCVFVPEPPIPNP